MQGISSAGCYNKSVYLGGVYEYVSFFFLFALRLKFKCSHEIPVRPCPIYILWKKIIRLKLQVTEWASTFWEKWVDVSFGDELQEY